MKRAFLLLMVGVAAIGCSSGPRDATNDPEVQAMLKGVEEQGKMPANGGGAQAAPAGATPAAAPTPAGG